MHRHRLARITAAALAATALAAPVASARVPLEEQTSTSAYPGVAAPTSQYAATADVAAAHRPAPTVTQTIDDGFDWGSAAIGAGGAGAILLLTAAGASAVGHRRHGVA